MMHHSNTLDDYCKKYGIYPKEILYQQSPQQLEDQTLALGQGTLSSTGALVVSTGAFTGRSPKDKFIVKDHQTEHTVDWNDFNHPILPSHFDRLLTDIALHLKGKSVWIRDAFACDHPKHRLSVRVLNEDPWSNLFIYNMFLRPAPSDLRDLTTDWLIIQAPSFQANPAIHGTRQSHFSVTYFAQKIILIGGTAYTGEMKKGIFSVLNYILPLEKKVLGMHCSANKSKEETAIFFGLSGTGKTTLSATAERTLIGDDEHGWTDEGVFNFEGGCYAKCIDLSFDKEPDIFRAIRKGALVENVTFFEGTNEIDFASRKITENTRVSYPLDFIANTCSPALGGVPKNIFFLTCDAFGVLPPISKLSVGQAMYQFLSGYTAKVAGTEEGVKEPVSTFSTCFGAPFMPLNPVRYAELLGEKLHTHHTHIWLVNTGWTGGAYGVGTRMQLSYTRTLINEALNENLLKQSFVPHPVFGFQMPEMCVGVDTNVMNPRNAWKDKAAYDAQARHLAGLFVANFKRFESFANEEIRQSAPLA